MCRILEAIIRHQKEQNHYNRSSMVDVMGKSDFDKDPEESETSATALFYHDDVVIESKY